MSDEEITSGLSSIITEGVQFVPPEADYDPCFTCGGKGGTLECDSDGDGVWTTPVTYVNYCPDCIEAAQCPRCGWGIGLVQDIEDVCCVRCGWSFDVDRFYESEEP